MQQDAPHKDKWCQDRDKPTTTAAERDKSAHTRTNARTDIYHIAIVSKCWNWHAGGLTYQVFEYPFGTCLDEYVAEGFHLLHAHGIVQGCPFQLEHRQSCILTVYSIIVCGVLEESASSIPRAD
jgi:hypothetical protein